MACKKGEKNLLLFIVTVFPLQQWLHELASL